MVVKAYRSKMNFMTLQRPTFDELERRRQLRDTLSPQRSSTLQRKESVLSRGFNAIMRRQSMMSPTRPTPTNLRRNDSFFMHSTLSKDPDSIPPLSMMTNDEDRHPLHTIVHNTNNNPRGRNLGRAKSFKYPERISQIPPAELTRLRSKSQVRPDNQQMYHPREMSSSEDPVYTSGSGGSAAGSGKSGMLRRNPTYLSNNNRNNNNANTNNLNNLGYGQAAQWLAHEKFFQPPPQPQRLLPRPQKPNPRDISEPPPTTSKRRLPLPDIFYYGDRWQEQESRSNRGHPRPPQSSSIETPEPPPGSSDISNNNNNR